MSSQVVGVHMIFYLRMIEETIKYMSKIFILFFAITVYH